MVNIEIVDLSQHGVTLPNGRVGMVIAQPFLSLTDVEPYQCTLQAKPSQLAVLTDTLAVARAALHGEEPIEPGGRSLAVGGHDQPGPLVVRARRG